MLRRKGAYKFGECTACAPSAHCTAHCTFHATQASINGTRTVHKQIALTCADASRIRQTCTDLKVIHRF